MRTTCAHAQHQHTCIPWCSRTHPPWPSCGLATRTASCWAATSPPSASPPPRTCPASRGGLSPRPSHCAVLPLTPVCRACLTRLPLLAPQPEPALRRQRQPGGQGGQQARVERRRPHPALWQRPGGPHAPHGLPGSVSGVGVACLTWSTSPVRWAPPAWLDLPALHLLAARPGRQSTSTSRCLTRRATTCGSPCTGWLAGCLPTPARALRTRARR